MCDKGWLGCVEIGKGDDRSGDRMRWRGIGGAGRRAISGGGGGSRVEEGVPGGGVEVEQGVVAAVTGRLGRGGAGRGGSPGGMTG